MPGQCVGHHHPFRTCLGVDVCAGNLSGKWVLHNKADGGSCMHLVSRSPGRCMDHHLQSGVSLGSDAHMGGAGKTQLLVARGTSRTKWGVSQGGWTTPQGVPAVVAHLG